MDDMESVAFFLQALAHSDADAPSLPDGAHITAYMDSQDAETVRLTDALGFSETDCLIMTETRAWAVMRRIATEALWHDPDSSYRAAAARVCDNITQALLSAVRIACC
jgi:hypothetical protein